jgi:hypothetical protein
MDTGFTFADVYDDVVSRAGGEQTTAEDVVRVQRGLRLLLERWEARGFNTWRFRYFDTRSPDRGAELFLPADVDDVIHVVRGTGGTLERVPIDEMMAFDFNRVKGTPGSWALLRDERPKILLYPSGTAMDLRIWYVQRPEHYQRGSANMDDVPGRWLEAMILGLAHDLARKRPPYDEALIGRLKAEAAEAEDIALRADRDRARYRMRFAY